MDILQETFYTESIQFFDRLTCNHADEITRNHISILYFTIKQLMFKQYFDVFYMLKNNYDYVLL